MRRDQIPLSEARKHVDFQKYVTYFDLIPSIKAFTQNALGFPNSSSYQKFLPESKQPHWVLSAVRSDKLIPKVWSFPIVGDMAYIGYFKIEDVHREQGLLQADGYDTYVRTSSAFSSLGYFDMPIFESMIQRGDLEFVETLIHELAHEAFYRFGYTSFNEGLAQFLAEKGTLAYVSAHAAMEHKRGEYETSLQKHDVYRSEVMKTWRELQAILGEEEDAFPVEQWKYKKEAAYERLISHLKAEGFQMADDTWNNARLYSEVVYIEDHCYFEVVFEQKAFKALDDFFSWVKATFHSDDPSEKLHKMVQEGACSKNI